MADSIVAGVEYRDVEGFDGYRVGTDGSVWSCLTVGRIKGTTHNGSGFTQRDPNNWHRLKASRPDDKHYSHVRLCRDCKPHTREVHRLVLEAFRGPCPTGMEGCHNDGNRENCALENLRWDTPTNNHADKVRHGTGLRGSMIYGSKLTEQMIPEIFRLSKLGLSQRAIGKRVGIRQSGVSRILNGSRWKHVSAG